jgi:tetratricopeptide (TPR) repeat protein
VNSCIPLVSFVLLTSATGSAQQTIENTSSQRTVLASPFDSPVTPLSRSGADWPLDGTPSRPTLANPTVSVEELRHKVPKRALKEYEKGRQAFAKGDCESALRHFQNTIQLDADFADGHNDLGVTLAKLGNREEAAEEFQRAVKLAPQKNLPLSNLCISLYMLRHYEDVVPLAHRALKADPTLLYVRYVLAATLMLGRGDTNEALGNLELAAPKFPKARLLASEILVTMARREDAAWELAEYLRSVPKSDSFRHQVELQLAELQQ